MVFEVLRMDEMINKSEVSYKSVIMSESEDTKRAKTKP